MRKTLGVCLLVLLLSGSASAGIMGNDDAAQSEPPTTSGETLNGEIPTPPGIPESLTQIALTLLASVLP